MASLPVRLKNGRIRVGERFSVSFQRTLRIPDDGRVYPLPPGLGHFPIHRVGDYKTRVPHAWSAQGGFFIPMYQREALWIAFDGAPWKPNAVKVAIGRINAVSGLGWNEQLHADPQDYVVCPDQPWLDGINTGTGTVRQFVAVPLGRGVTVEGQLSGSEEFGGIQLLIYEPKPQRFPDEPPPQIRPFVTRAMSQPAMGLGAGGIMKQKIYPDPYGLDTWDQTECGSVVVHLLNTEQYQHVTGSHAPATPVTAEEYTTRGFPWFDLYDESAGDLPASERLKGVKTLREASTEEQSEAEESIEIDERRVRKLGRTAHDGKRKR